MSVLSAKPALKDIQVDDLFSALNIDWTSKEGLDVALKYHFDDGSRYHGLDYYEKAKLLCNQFKPSEIRIVYQGIWTDAGRDWRSLPLNKYRYSHMSKLAPAFAKECMHIMSEKEAVSGNFERKKDR